jgi:hypothetical protein
MSIFPTCANATALEAEGSGCVYYADGKCLTKGFCICEVSAKDMPDPIDTAGRPRYGLIFDDPNIKNLVLAMSDKKTIFQDIIFYTKEAMASAYKYGLTPKKALIIVAKFFRTDVRIVKRLLKIK